MERREQVLFAKPTQCQNEHKHFWSMANCCKEDQFLRPQGCTTWITESPAMEQKFEKGKLNVKFGLFPETKKKKLFYPQDPPVHVLSLTILDHKF